MRIYHPENTFHYPEKLEIKLFLVGAVALANIFCWAAALLYAQMGAKIGSAHLYLFTNLISVFNVYTKLEMLSV